MAEPQSTRPKITVNRNPNYWAKLSPIADEVEALPFREGLWAIMEYLDMLRLGLAAKAEAPTVSNSDFRAAKKLFGQYFLSHHGNGRSLFYFWKVYPPMHCYEFSVIAENTPHSYVGDTFFKITADPDQMEQIMQRFMTEFPGYRPPRQSRYEYAREGDVVLMHIRRYILYRRMPEALKER